MTIRKNPGYSNRPFEIAMPALLGKNTNNNQRRRPVQTYEELPPVNNGEIDGRDHINVHHHGKTDLGRALSMHGQDALIHPKYGSFLTVFGLVAWLSSPNQPDEFRTMSAKDIDARLQVTEKTHMPDFGFQVMWATWYKIKSHPKLENWLKNSTLKFEHYYLSRTIDPSTKKRTDVVLRIRNASSRWMIKGMEELRAALVANREPNLDMILPAKERDKLNKQRKLEAQQKPVAKETDVILEANLRKEAAEGQVKKERTPEQIERKRAKNKAAKDRRNERRASEGLAVHTNPPQPAGDNEGPNTIVEITPTNADGSISEPQLCTLGIKDVDVVSPAGVITLNLSEIPRTVDSDTDEVEAREDAIDSVVAKIERGEQITIFDIKQEFIQDVNGVAFLGHLRLNGITLTKNGAPA